MSDRVNLIPNIVRLYRVPIRGSLVISSALAKLVHCPPENPGANEALFGEAGADAFEDAEGLHEALHRQGEGEFDDRLQFAVLAALHGFEAVKFEAHDAVDDRHLA